MSNIAQIVASIVIIVVIDVLLLRRGWSVARLAISAGVATVVGLVWGLIAILASSPNPPAWTQHAMPFVGLLSGVGFVLLFMILRKWRR